MWNVDNGVRLVCTFRRNRKKWRSSDTRKKWPCARDVRHEPRKRLILSRAFRNRTVGTRSVSQELLEERKEIVFAHTRRKRNKTDIKVEKRTKGWIRGKAEKKLDDLLVWTVEENFLLMLKDASRRKVRIERMKDIVTSLIEISRYPINSHNHIMKYPR